MKPLPLFQLLALFLLPALALAPGGGCSRIGNRNERVAVVENKDSVPVSDLTDEARQWADSVADSMTLEEMAGQVLMPAIYARATENDIEMVRKYAADVHVGGVILLKGTRADASRIAAILRDCSLREPFVAIDAEWGLGMRLSDMPVYPANGEISREAGEEELYDYGLETARECRGIGINMVLGPVADVSGRGGLLGKRSFGSDPERVARLTVAYSRGLEDGNVFSVAKHFPGHGSPGEDSHRTLPVIDRDKATLDSIDLLPFRAYVNAGLSGIMAGHLEVPAFDTTGRPASFSRELLTGELRERMGFRGLILTDALNMGGAEGYDAVDALLAGADIVLAPADTQLALSRLLAAVRSGRLSSSELGEKVRRILFFKYMLTLPEGTPPQTLGPDSIRHSLTRKL